MVKLSDVANDPNYDGAASGASKATITVFVGTFAYLVFFSAVRPGIIGGAIFFLVGMFAASLLISMPFFLLRTKIPKLGLLVSISEIAATIFATRAIYLWLFSSSVQ